MAVDGLSDRSVRAVLAGTRRIAVVGASASPWRPSNGVMGFLLRQGFDVTPVNPRIAGQTLHGRVVVESLADAAPLEMVDVFRAPQHVGALMEEAIRLGAKAVWLQLGVIDEVAAAAGRAAGLTVVMNRCPAIEWPRLGLRAPR
ncbi:MAG: CoA-binding protein [Acidisphaera sp.]|nr:CoA-binding protein [Acidisphaera sp.]